MVATDVREFCWLSERPSAWSEKRLFVSLTMEMNARVSGKLFRDFIHHVGCEALALALAAATRTRGKVNIKTRPAAAAILAQIKLNPAGHHKSWQITVGMHACARQKGWRCAHFAQNPRARYWGARSHRDALWRAPHYPDHTSRIQPPG